MVAKRGPALAAPPELVEHPEQLLPAARPPHQLFGGGCRRVEAQIDHPAIAATSTETAEVNQVRSRRIPQQVPAAARTRP
jgi:hypothetical protein